jgi:hypothetical protein
MREKAKVDGDFRRRLIEFISHVASETLPEQPPVSTEEECSKGSRVFQPLLDPEHRYFDNQMKVDVYDIVTSRNMHNPKHTPTCFKFNRKRCRARFPRKLVASTQFDSETGVIEIQRDDEWLNGYNKWLSLMTHANHDCQFLLTKDHAISIMYYIMKYISKPEAASHTKLTIAAAVRDAMQNCSYMADVDVTKRFLIKTYNKLDTQREVGVPEAISHLLNLPDHYTDAVFGLLHTSHLLQYVKQFSHYEQEEHEGPCSDNDMDNMLDVQVIKKDQKYGVISSFDDYAYRGPSLADLCLYDYCSIVYKKKRKGGIRFTVEHPQHQSHCQFIRQDSYAVPNLLGRLLFVTKTSEDLRKREDYYCILSFLFMPWSYHSAHRAQDQLWEQFYHTNVDKISSRHLCHIDNLDLLHRSKEESQIDVLQQKARSDEMVLNILEGEEMLGSYEDGQISDQYDEIDADEDLDDIIDGIMSSLFQQNNDWYVQEALDANLDSGYLSSPADWEMVEGNTCYYCRASIDEMKNAIEVLKIQMKESAEATIVSHSLKEPSVFLTGPAEIEVAIQDLIRKYTLNREQSRALRIVAHQSLGINRVGDQLLMGVFGEGGTGKSRVIEAIRGWFNFIGQGHRLIVTATTGAAAVRINGSTLHSAVGIPVEAGDREKEIKVSRVTDKQVLRWKQIDYIVIDEVSMMDAKVMMQLNKTLNLLRGSNQEHDGKPFGGVNILFFGDFFQLPSVSKLDLWRDKLGRWQQAHDLWRSLNAVIILTQQMRQAEDSRYAEAMARLRIHEPTDEDIAMLNSRIGAPIPNMPSAPIIVRRHYVRHALNLQKLKETAAATNTPIIHCKAEVVSNHELSMHQLYSIIQGPKKSFGDGILSVIPGAPLMITKNLNHLPVPLVNGSIVEFYGFSNDTNPDRTSAIIDLPRYMLVKLRSEDQKSVQIPGLPVNVVPIWPESFRYNAGHGRWARLKQFPATLAYAITDFKCQGQTYEWLRVDIKKPHTGAASVMSPYVQLSRAQSLQRLSILRPFNSEDLRTPIPNELAIELEWEQRMSELTMQIYS